MHDSPVKMALDLAVTGMQALRLQGKSRGVYRVKADSSYVDETLFASPLKPSRVVLADFDPPWSEKISPQRPLAWSPNSSGVSKTAESPKSSSPASTPRNKYKYRVKRRCPSFCDETLFGPRLEEPSWEAPWSKKEDTPKLRPLLWTPPSASRVQSSRPARAKQCPLKAIHPQTPQSPPADFQTEYKGTSDFWKRPDSDAESTSWREGRANSLSSGHPSSAAATGKNCQRASQSAPNAPTTFHNARGVARPRSVSFSGLDHVRRSATSSVHSAKPPWK